MDETNKKNKRTKISHKIATLIILFALILTAATTTVGYFVFKSNTERVYNDSAYNTAKVAASYISPELLKEYSDLAKEYVAGNVSQEQILSVIESADYKNIRALIVNLKEDMGANDIFIVYPDMEVMWSYGNIPDEEWNPMLYIFDSYIDENYSYYLGNVGPFNPKFIEDIDKIITTGERSDNYFVSKSVYGYNTSAVYPIYLNNELVGVVGTEIPMVTISDTLRKYLIIVTLLALAIMALVITLISMILNKIIVKPINVVASEAEKFVEDTSVISMKLNDIRTNDEIENLSQSIMTMEYDINRYIAEVKSVTAEKERIGAELNIAKNIQKSMLPIIFPAFPERKDFDIYASMDPAKEVGGDFYDFFLVDDSHLAMVVADVSGKGVPAALFMVIGKTLIKDHTNPGLDLGTVFSEVNNMLCQTNSEQLFITAFEAVIDLKTGEVSYVNAGHEHPFIMKKQADGSYKYEEVVPKSGIVLAAMEDMRYVSGRFNLEPGDRLIQYTDGVTEATNANNELYGMERLGAYLNKNTDKKPEELLHGLKEDIDAFVGEAPQFDDITMLCFEYNEKMD